MSRYFLKTSHFVDVINIHWKLAVILVLPFFKAACRVIYSAAG